MVLLALIALLLSMYSSRTSKNVLLTFFINFAGLEVEMNVGHISELLERCENTEKNWVPKTGTQKTHKTEKNRVYLETI